jgi:hypothetical protein
MLRGRISKIHRAANGTLLFQYDVTLDSGIAGSFDNPGVLTNVLQLFPGFQKPERELPTPTGMVYIPEIGSRVLVIFDGHRWVIAGFYSGPVSVSSENANDKMIASYNPGIETTLPRTDNTRLLGDIPSWAYGLEPGDVVLGKGDARFKVTDFGAVVGSGPTAFCLWKRDGEVLEQWYQKTQRAPGYRFSTNANLGTERSLAVSRTSFESPPIPQASYSYTCEIIESSPWIVCGMPYAIHQRGQLRDPILVEGRAALEFDYRTTEALESAATKRFAMIHDAVVQPLVPGGLDDVGGAAIGRTAVAMYDFQVDADGSFRLRSGNTARLPLQPLRSVRSNDMQMEYDAVTGDFELEIGTGPRVAVKLTLNGRTGEVTLVGSKVTLGSSLDALVPPTSKLEITPTTVGITAPTLKIQAAQIDAPTAMAKFLAAQATSLKAAGIEMALHRHSFMDNVPGGLVPNTTFPAT